MPHMPGEQREGERRGGKGEKEGVKAASKSPLRPFPGLRGPKWKITVNLLLALPREGTGCCFKPQGSGGRKMKQSWRPPEARRCT